METVLWRLPEAAAETSYAKNKSFTVSSLFAAYYHAPETTGKQLL